MAFRPFTTVVIDEDDTAPPPTHGNLSGRRPSDVLPLRAPAGRPPSNYVGGDGVSFRGRPSLHGAFLENLNVRSNLVLSRDATLTFEGDDGATFFARELRELLEWVRLNRAPPRMPRIESTEELAPDGGV